MPQGQVIVHVERKAGAQPCCPTCSKPAPGYDSRRRRWRHLDTCQYKTILEADVPRVKCPEHGVVTTTVPWAEPNSGFTALFEALVIDWLKEASTSAVARLMGLSWNAIDGIEMVPGAESKIAFDKFHVAKYLGEAVDKVRREEHRKLMKAGKADLKGTKYDWLSNPKNMTRRQKQRFKALRDSTLKTARA